MIRLRHILAAGFAVVATVGMLSVGTRVGVAPESIPPQVADRQFWRMIADFSESDGYFRSDNLISNESSFQHVVPELRTHAAPGGVYLGVGPDQNFTYIVALRPRIAFILDIRRQNLALHLMYKALIELSTDRAEFLSRLFSRPRPAGLGAASTVAALFDAYATVAADEALFQANLRDIVNRLIVDHGFDLTDADVKTIEYVYDAFYKGGPEIRYSFPRGYGGRWFPTYADLMMETDTRGTPHSYLATEEHFRILSEIERRNLIVPLVGDFAGDKALPSIGRYLADHNATVTAFYTSNVEQYLFQGDGWKRFFANVARLPLDEESVFIRAYFNMGLRSGGLATASNTRSATLLDPILAALAGVNQGRIRSYYDLAEQAK